jgi:hypothetical protein
VILLEVIKENIRKMCQKSIKLIEGEKSRNVSTENVKVKEITNCGKSTNKMESIIKRGIVEFLSCFEFKKSIKMQ